MKFEIIILFIIMVILNIAASEMYRDQKNIFWNILRYICLILIPIICLLCNIYQQFYKSIGKNKKKRGKVMRKCIFAANGKKFNTYAEARKESRFIDVEYIENWVDPFEIKMSAKILAEYKKSIAHLNTPELCKARLAQMRG